MIGVFIHPIESNNYYSFFQFLAFWTICLPILISIYNKFLVEIQKYIEILNGSRILVQ